MRGHAAPFVFVGRRHSVRQHAPDWHRGEADHGNVPRLAVGRSAVRAFAGHRRRIGRRSHGFSGHRSVAVKTIGTGRWSQPNRASTANVMIATGSAHRTALAISRSLADMGLDTCIRCVSGAG